MTILIAPGVVHAAYSGTPTFGAVDQVPTPTTFTPASSSINVTAGSATVSAIDRVGATGLFTLNFTGVSFSSQQFFLYLSKDGLNNVNTTSDIKYAGPFSKSDFVTYTGTLHKVTFGTAPNVVTYYIGTTSGDVPVIEGPIPIHISSDDLYVKAYDGSCGTSPSFCGQGVAVAAGLLYVQPGITLSQISGPAGTLVSISGGGFPENEVIDFVASYTYYSWSGVSTPENANWTTGFNTGLGYFTTNPKAIADTKQSYNPANGVQAASLITLSAKEEHYPHTLFASANFSENTRVFNQVVSYESGQAVVTWTPIGTYGNDTGVGTTFPIVQVYYSGTLGIVGNYTVVGTTVTATIGSAEQSVTSNPTTGYFVINITVPSLTVGPHLVSVTNNGVVYMFSINMNPTLILTPSAGSEGKIVSVAAYGFPTAGSIEGFNGQISLYWFEHNWNDGTNFFLINATVGSNGEFNITNVRFTVPHTFGGDHDVTASTLYEGQKAGYFDDSSYTNYITRAEFNVLPTLTVSPSTVNSNVEGFIVAFGTGFCPVYECEYTVNVDHSTSGSLFITGGLDGDLQINFTSAGFAPGIHQVEVDCYQYDDAPNCSSGNYYGNVSAPAAFAYFNVTAIGSTIGGGSGSLPSSVIDTINNINTNVGTILGWGTMINTINTNVGTINTNVGTIGNHVDTILGWQSTILGMDSNVTKILGWQSIITGMNTKLDSIISTLGTMTTAVNTAASNALAASNAATDTKNSVSSTETYVLVVAVLAAITLVLELAILVRKLD